MMRTTLPQLQMRQHWWKSLDVRVVTNEIENCLLIMHNVLVILDSSLHAIAMDWL
jgi:hypothetical protein